MTTAKAPFPPVENPFATLREAEEAIPDYSRCVECDSLPRPVKLALLTWQEGFGHRCNCKGDRTLAPLYGKQIHPVRRRYARMVDKALEQRPNVMPLSLEEIKQYISPRATEAEAFVFLRYCQAMELDPFAKDAYLVKYADSAPASIVISIDMLHRRAARHPDFKPLQSGIVVENDDGNLVYRDGEIVPAGHKLIGGWAEGNGYRSEVSFERWSRNQATWKSMPERMIKTAAEREVLRKGYVSEINPLFVDPEGLNIDVGDPVAEKVEEAKVIDSTAREIPEAPVEGLGQCPEHDTDWEKGQYGLYHGIPGAGFCDQNKQINNSAKAVMGEAAVVLEWDDKRVAGWIKDTYGKTWSKLSNEDKISATEALHALATKRATEGEERPPPATSEALADTAEAEQEGAYDAGSQQRQNDEDNEALGFGRPNGTPA